jgi:hypothetical protein
MIEITERHLDELRKNQQKPHYASEAKSLFIDGLFNYANWNGGDAIVRQYFSAFGGKVRSGTLTEEIQFKFNKWTYEGDIIINHTVFNDYNYANIIFHHYACDEDDDKVIEWRVSTMNFIWYKNRGTIETALFDGDSMIEHEYLFTLNALQATGFEFDLQ